LLGVDGLAEKHPLLFCVHLPSAVQSKELTEIAQQTCSRSMGRRPLLDYHSSGDGLSITPPLRIARIHLVETKLDRLKKSFSGSNYFLLFTWNTAGSGD